MDCETTVQTAGADGSIQAVGKGMATLQIADPATGEVGVTVKVHALLCPGLRRDLLSIPSLCVAGFVAQFGPDEAFIMSSDGKQQAPLLKRGKLWIAQIVRAVPAFAGAAPEPLDPGANLASQDQPHQLRRSLPGLSPRSRHADAHQDGRLRVP